MAASIGDELSVYEPVAAPQAVGEAAQRPLAAREAGRALEILGHAIEYLADEYVRDNSAATEKAGTLEAIQILMAVNREVYFTAPTAPSIMRRLRSLFSRFEGYGLKPVQQFQ